MSNYDVLEIMRDRDDELAAEWLDTLGTKAFKEWYRSVVFMHNQCNYYINEYGLEHLRDEYER